MLEVSTSQSSFDEKSVGHTKKGSVECRNRVAEFLSHSYPSWHVNYSVLTEDICNLVVAG